jgi:hypothetical protein
VCTFLGVVRFDCGDMSYIIEDDVGYMEKIWREDIIDEDTMNTNIELEVTFGYLLQS